MKQYFHQGSYSDDFDKGYEKQDEKKDTGVVAVK